MLVFSVNVSFASTDNIMEVSVIEDNDIVKIIEYNTDDYKYLAILDKEIQNINIKVIDRITLETVEEYVFESEDLSESGFSGELVNLETDESFYLDSEELANPNARFVAILPATVVVVTNLITAILVATTVTLVVVAAGEVTKVLIDKFKDKNPTVIYRLGSGSYTNLTPRTQDTTGLSYTTSKPSSGYTATTVQAINATGKLVAVKDGASHVSVKPVNMGKMKEWINSRATAESKPHEYTKILRGLSVRVK